MIGRGLKFIFAKKRFFSSNLTFISVKHIYYNQKYIFWKNLLFMQNFLLAIVF